MFEQLVKLLVGGANAPAPAAVQQTPVPMPQANPETAPQHLAQPVPMAAPGVGQQLGNHFANMNWRNTFDDAAAGLANMDPTRPALQALAMGYSGARGNSQARSSAGQEAQLAEQERQRSLEKHQADMKSAQIGNLNTASQIEDRERKGKAKQSLTVSDKISLERVVNDYGQKLGLNSTLIDQSKRPALLEQMEKYREEVTKRLMAGDTPEEAAQNAEGAGTEESQYHGLTEPVPYNTPASLKNPLDFEALPPGSYFINPADNSIRMKLPQ